MGSEISNVSVDLSVPRFFPATPPIKTFFEVHKIAADLKEIATKSDQYCFIVAYPYSGDDTSELYCYVRRGKGWIMFLRATLWKTRTVNFQVEGDFINVVRGSDVVLKINAPK